MKMTLLATSSQRLTLWSKSFLRSPVSSQIIPRHVSKKKYESKKWPGYQVVYNLEPVKTVSIVNRLKLHTSIITAVSIPLTTGLEVMLQIPSAFVHNTAVLFTAIAVFFHGVGYFCNNVIGIIYAKDDSDDLKIAYVDYWGRRRDIDTTFDDIYSPKQKTSLLADRTFHNLKIESQNKTLRLLIQGKVVDEDKFQRLIKNY